METLSGLQLEVRNITDNVDSDFISDAELTSYINYAQSELYDMCVSVDAEPFVATTAHSITASGVDVYSLASDHMQVYAVDLTDGSNTWTLERDTFASRNRLKDKQHLLWADDFYPYRWSTVGNDRIRIIPDPGSGYTVNVWYVPSITALSSGSDTTHAAFEKWMDRYIVLSAAITVKTKAEENTQSLMVERQRIEQRLKDSANNKMFISKHFARDVRD